MKKFRLLTVLFLTAVVSVISLCLAAYADPCISVSDERLTKYIFNTSSDFDGFSAKIVPASDESYPYSIAFLMTNKPESYDELDEYSIADPERVDCADEKSAARVGFLWDSYVYKEEYTFSVVLLDDMKVGADIYGTAGDGIYDVVCYALIAWGEVQNVKFEQSVNIAANAEIDIEFNYEYNEDDEANILYFIINDRIYFTEFADLFTYSSKFSFAAAAHALANNSGIAYSNALNVTEVCGQIPEEFTSYTSDSCAHEWGEWSYAYNSEIKGDWTPACTRNGRLQRFCALCPATDYTYEEKLPHPFEKSKVLEWQTCTDEGLALYLCSVCGKEDERPIPADGHLLQFWTTTIEPTCISTGTGINICEICYDEIEFEIPVTDHSYGEPVIGGSCTEPSTETYTCTVCGDIKVVEISAAPGHIWGKWIVDQSVCDVEGEKTRYCSVCNESEIEIIPAGNHDWVDWKVVVAPGCTTNGTETRTCIDCFSTATRSTDPLGHKWGDWQTATEPTYLENGTKIHYCVVCNESETGPIDKKQNPFTDVKANKWYTDPILFCLQNEYMVGTSDSVFSLSQPVTRAMIVQIMAKIAGADLAADEYQNSTFVDVANGKWYTSAVTWANKNGLASGIGQNHFGYKNSITREELAVFLMKLAEFGGYSTTARGALQNGYKDIDRIHSWAYEALDWALTDEVMHGSTSQHVSPRVPLTRAQVAEIVYDYCNKVLGK